MTIKELRKLIREAIEDVKDFDDSPSGNPDEDRPMFERDDVGKFYAVLHPKGNEKVNEIVFETNVHGYKDAVGENNVAAIVKNEARAKAIGDKLLKGKLHELTSGIDSQINTTKTQIKELEAVVGSIKHYYDLKEADPKHAEDKAGEYLKELSSKKQHLQELEQQKADIKAGKLPNTTDPNVTKNPDTLSVPSPVGTGKPNGGELAESKKKKPVNEMFGKNQKKLQVTTKDNKTLTFDVTYQGGDGNQIRIDVAPNKEDVKFIEVDPKRNEGKMITRTSKHPILVKIVSGLDESHKKVIKPKLGNKPAKKVLKNK